MRPLKITAVMQSGQVLTDDTYLPLDSILAAQWVRKNHPGEFYSPKKPGDIDGLMDIPLPLENRGEGDDWYWACSFNRGTRLKEYIAYWHRRFDDHLEGFIEFGKRRGKIDVKAGKHKSYRMPVVVMLFDRLEWYAVGDMDAVMELCRMATHIGKKPAQGRGAVERWIVEPWHEDWSEVDGHGGLTRALQATPGDIGRRGGVTARRYGIRPPYWHPGHQRLCLMPRPREGRP